MEEGAIWYNGLRWEWRPVSELRLPAGRRALIAQRLARFSSSTQAVLATAAIIGREFDVGLAGWCWQREVNRRSASRSPRRVPRVCCSSTYERKQGGFAFVHDEIAEVLVESIPRDQVRQLHQRVAQSLEKRRPDRLGEIALHYDAAGESADAYRTAQTAAKAAERVYAPAAAGAYLQVAARNATTPAELAEVRVALAQVAETGGRLDEVEELCDLAIEWFDGQSDAASRTDAAPDAGARANGAGSARARDTRGARRSSMPRRMRLGDDRERIALLMIASQTYGRLGDQRTAARMARRIRRCREEDWR